MGSAVSSRSGAPTANAFPMFYGCQNPIVLFTSSDFVPPTSEQKIFIRTSGCSLRVRWQWDWVPVCTQWRTSDVACMRRSRRPSPYVDHNVGSYIVVVTLQFVENICVQFSIRQWFLTF